MIHTLEDIYLDWFNNYVSTEKFASAYDLTVKQAGELINLLAEIKRGDNK